MDLHEAYLHDLGAPLVGARRAKRDLLREVRDHLDDATAAYLDDGQCESDAASAAQRDFGDPMALRAAYQACLSAGLLRRVGLLMVLSLAAQVIAWPAEGQGSSEQAQLHDLVTWVGICAGACALGALVICGRGVRWWGRRPALMRGASLAMLIASVLILGIAALMNQRAAGGSGVAGLGFAAAVVGLPFGWVLVDSLRVLRGLERVAA